jgi:subtilisin family serine protease
MLQIPSARVDRNPLGARGATRAVCVSLLISATTGFAIDRPTAFGNGGPLRYTPNELLVKLKPEVAGLLRQQLGQGRAASTIELSESLNRLGKAYRVTKISPVFEDFPAVKQRLQALRFKDLTMLTETEQRLLRRGSRAPMTSRVPALERIFKLELEPGAPVEAAVDEYNADPDVLYAEPDYYLSVDLIPNDPYFAKQWPLRNTRQYYPVPGGGNTTGSYDSDIDADEAWDALLPGDAVIVAIVDSGVDYSHSDLVSSMWTDNSGYYGYDFVNDDNDPMDDFGHGTHCAGIVAAGFDNGIGISGVCPNARIMALKSIAGDGDGETDDAVEAIYYAVNHGADVISNSWGTRAYSQTLQDTIDYAHSQGVIVVASAGNDNWMLPRYPASYADVIAVASTDSDDVKVPTSSFGDWIDISAPGVDILSLRASGTDMYGDGQHFFLADYYIASGTSMACPHVAAVGALLVSQYSETSWEQIRARLLGTTDEITTQNPGFAHLLGAGRLNAAKALTDEEHPAIIFVDYEILDEAFGNGNGALEPGETASLSVVLRNIWTNAEDVHATLGSASPYVEVIDGTSGYGSIAFEEEKNNVHDLFAITLNAAAPPDEPLEFSLSVTAAGAYTRLLGFDLTRHIRLQDGAWPKSFGGHEPVPYDLDGDGDVELITKAPGNTIQILQPDGSVSAVLGGGEDGINRPAVGDIQRDGHVEVVALRFQDGIDNMYLSVWRRDGSYLCPPVFLEPRHWAAPPVLYDLDDDGDLEIITGGKKGVGNTISIRTFTWHVDAVVPELETLLEASELHGITNIAVGDLDAGNPQGDHAPEFVFAAYRTYVSDGAQVFAVHSDGQLVQGWPIELPEGGSSPILADLTGDGNLEIVVNAYNSAGLDGLSVWRNDGSPLWHGSGRGRAPVVADIDGDGDPEVLTQTKAYHHDGTDTGWSYTVTNPNGLSVGDIDGDGDMEVLIGGANSDGLRAFHHDGSPVDGFPLFIDPVYRLVRMTPVLADLDRDGDIEIITGGRHLAVWDLYSAYDPANIESSMYRYDPYRTGCYNANINLPPVWYVAPENQVFVRTVEHELYVQATDPEGKSVVHDILDVPDGAQFEVDGAGLRFRWQPQMDDLEADVAFCATDDDGERIEKTIHISLANAPCDLDDDGDVDWADARWLLICLSVSGPMHPPVSPVCDPAEIDTDDDVDLSDFRHLQATFSGSR